LLQDLDSLLTRLVHRPPGLLTARGVDVFTAFCESHASDIPFHVVARLLSAATGVGAFMLSFRALRYLLIETATPPAGTMGSG
jgi:hypothetical protein